jgi:signal transduction histidine kinase/CheY-like chemotaxis protein
MGEQLRALTRLQKVSLSLTASLSLDEVLDAILEAAMMICGADCAALSYLDGSGALRLMRHRGLSEEYLRQRHITSSDPAVSPLLTGKEPLIVEDIDSLRGVSPNYEAWKNEGIRSIVSLPLIRGGQVFGMIGAGSRTGRRYTQTGTEAMAILASQASAAITNARLFEQLREANKAKDDFLATLSHELRTPLSPILGWLHMLRRFSDSDPLLKQGIETVERNANQLAGLINDLLDLTRVISGKVELERQPTDLGALVQAAVEQVRPQLTARGLTIDVSLPERRIICNVDSVRIQQVLANLLNNAVKFTPEGGRVSVSIEATGDVSGDVAIEVADTGIGIEANFLPHVFERFTQAHGGINRRYGGLGLGLAITRAIVEAHGGVVTAASDGPRQGSRFRVRLPHVVVDLGTEPEEWLEPAVELGAADKIHARVLVIEDSQDTLEMLELWLRTFGCDVTVAQRAFDALRLAVEEKPDLIISDIGLPEIDGYELIRKLREVPGLETVPAIALTGYARDEDRDLATAAGYDAHLSKPAEMSRLLYLVRKLARR